MICCCGDRGKINIKQEFSISTYLNNELENEYNLLLSSSIYIQISYYPSKFWNNYLLSYLDEYNLPRDRIRSMNTDEYLELIPSSALWLPPNSPGTFQPYSRESDPLGVSRYHGEDKVRYPCTRPILSRTA